MSTSRWAFLGSPRFHALVIGAIALALYQDGVISLAWFSAIGTIAGGFIGIRTLDRNVGDAKVDAAAMSTDTYLAPGTYIAPGSKLGVTTSTTGADEMTFEKV